MTEADRTALAAELAAKKAALEALQEEIAGLERALGAGSKVSPLAPAMPPQVHPVPGVALASIAAGVRYRNRDDVMLARLDAGSVMAGTLTRSATRAAPVLWCEDRLAAAPEGPLAIVVNAGNANAFTGGRGVEAVRGVTEATGAALGLPAGSVFMASTGVIGEPLPAERITAHLETLSGALSEAPAAWLPAARAIMTTDTFPKLASVRTDVGGVPVSVSGFAKGSGMIAPDMATMLAFVFTDAPVDRAVLQPLVSRLADESFNAVTVDGDTSTSDTLLVGATGRAAMAPIASEDDPRLPAFADALGGVMKDLAIQVVRDGEGASKLAEITVAGAEDDGAARRVGLAIANSPLVKTALAGEDPNWGRIVMAIGKSGERAERDRIAIRFGDVLVAERGWVAPTYSEAAGLAEMRKQEISIAVELGIGSGRATVWTCDLTHRYIEINADYRS